jgi:hypothetical protein
VNIKPEPKAVPETEVLALLRRIGEDPVNEREPSEQDNREARFAARIDAHLVKLTGERSRSRRSRAIVISLAAALPLGLWAARAVQRPSAVLALEREPVPSAARPVSAARSVPTAPEPRAAVQVLPPKSAERAPLAPIASALPSAVGAKASGSTLGAENGLFQEAVSNAHAGNVEQALRGFEQLLHDHPQSPLAQTALVRKFRVLSAAGRSSEARAEARRYLQLYPAGFGQREAEIVASGQVPPGAADAGGGTETP